MTPSQCEKRALIVVEAATLGDPKTVEKHGIDVRTLQRWRKQAETDPLLSAAVAAKMAKVEAGWADEIPGALRVAIGFLRKAAEQADPKDPAAIHSVAGAMKLLSETSATWKVLDARLARQNRPPDQQAGSAAGATGAGSGSAAASAGPKLAVVS